MTPPPSDDDRCRRYERFARIDRAFKTGDLDALAAEAGDDDRFPDMFADLAIGSCLPYAIYHGPVALIAALVRAGANPNFDEGDGFPPLIAVMSTMRAAAAAPARPDSHQILRLLLASGADPDQRGVNDYTALHWAAETGDLEAIDILLAAGADPDARTRIDDYETPGELAERLGHLEAATRLATTARRADPRTR